MQIGWVGLGKLGLPCALALSKAGHKVNGYDVNPTIATYLEEKKVPYQEAKVEEYMGAGATVKLQPSIDEVVRLSDVIFIAVQTPHQPQYEGVTPIPDTRADFEYRYLIDAYREVNKAIATHWDTKIVVVVSTVLPGTFDRALRPYTAPNALPVYNPFYIAMGTTIPDFENPEFVLLGMDNEDAMEYMVDLYGTIHDAPLQHMSIPSAELTKVAYNTYIGMKIVFANTIMEICDKTGADSDQVIDALSLATDRLMSPKYLRGGMGDGGGCHPRDNIAMSWLADRLELSHNFFDDIMRARENQTQYLIDLAEYWADMTGLHIQLLGTAFKANIGLEVGSPALLMAHMMSGECLMTDYTLGTSGTDVIDGPAVFVVTTNHDRWPEYNLPAGSVVIDPWGYMPDQEGVTVIRVGRK